MRTFILKLESDLEYKGLSMTFFYKYKVFRIIIFFFFLQVELHDIQKLCITLFVMNSIKNSL